MQSALLVVECGDDIANPKRHATKYLREKASRRAARRYRSTIGTSYFQIQHHLAGSRPVICKKIDFISHVDSDADQVNQS